MRSFHEMSEGHRREPETTVLGPSYGSGPRMQRPGQNKLMNMPEVTQEGADGEHTSPTPRHTGERGW